MRRNEKVVVLGEDVGRLGGVFRATDGLLREFGQSRVIDTPLAESAIVGTAIGMALYGLKPVAEIQFQDFIYFAFDQIYSELSKFRYRSGGQFKTPVVIRTPYGGGVRGGSYHSQSGEAIFAHTPGLKVVIPSGPYDAKGLLISALRDDNPVIFMEPKKIYRSVREEVPENEYTVPLGKAKVVEEGSDISLFSYGAMMQVALEAREKALEQKLSTEVVDLRSIVPLDSELILNSVKKTGRIIILHEASKTGGFGSEIAAIVIEKAFEYLKAPVIRVTGYDTPFPYALENEYLPNLKRVLKAITKLASY